MELASSTIEALTENYAEQVIPFYIKIKITKSLFLFCI